MNLDEAREQARKLLGDIKPASGRGLIEVGRDALQAGNPFEAMTPKEFPLPGLLYFGLTQLLDVKPYGPWEKMRWGFTFDFKDRSFGFELRKFGLRVLCEPSNLDGSLLREMLGRALELTNVAEKYLAASVVPDQINAGNFSVDNLYHRLRDRYEFLKEKAEIAYQTPPPQPETSEQPFGTVISFFEQPILEGGALATAAVDAYFSLTEHLFCLALPFSSKTFADKGISEFLWSPWSTKAKFILDLQDSDTKDVYDQLLRIREEWRNPIAHGGFLSGHGSLYVHIAGAGAMPARLRRTPKGLSFGFRLTDDSFNQIVEVFARFDEVLKTGKLRSVVTWAESGLPVAFDSKSCAQYRAAMKSESDFDDLIERTSYFHDLNVNMDYY